MSALLASGDILDLLSALVEQSLISVDERTGRYSMLETVRQYSRERLLDDETAPIVRQRHFEAMFAFLESLGPAEEIDEATRATERIDNELENLRAAIEFGLASGQNRAVAKLLSSLHTYWYRIGSFEEPIGLFREALAPFADEDMDPELTGAVLDLGYCEMTQGYHDQARSTLERAIQICKRRGDTSRLSDCYRYLGSLLLAEKKPEEAEAIYALALEVNGGRDEGSKIAGRLGYVAVQRKDWPKAKLLLEQSLSALNGMSRVTASFNLIPVYLALDELDSARREILWLLGTFTGMQAIFGLMHVFDAVSVYAAALPDFGATAFFLGQADNLRQSAGQHAERSSHVDKARSAAQKALGAEEFERLHAEGAGVDMNLAAARAKQFVEVSSRA